MTRHIKGPWFYHHCMVLSAKEHGVKPAARHFHTTPATVCTWLRRWKEGSLEDLRELSRAHHNAKAFVTQEQNEQVLALPSFGARRIKEHFQLFISHKAIRRIWRGAALLKSKRTKYKTTQDPGAVKAQWRLFEQTYTDAKAVIDVPEDWPHIRVLALAKVKLTARDVTSGTLFTAFADERALCYAAFFAHPVLARLNACQVRFHDCRLHTGNGSEFIGAWNAREQSLFSTTVHSSAGTTDTTIPAGPHTWQADVQTVDRLIEDDFCEIECSPS